jgi:hypothetical protein
MGKKEDQKPWQIKVTVIALTTFGFESQTEVLTKWMFSEGANATECVNPHLTTSALSTQRHNCTYHGKAIFQKNARPKVLL